MSTVGGDDVCLAVLGRLRSMLPARVDADARLGPVQEFRVVADFDSQSSDGQLPQVSVDSPGLAERPDEVYLSSQSWPWAVVVTVLHRHHDDVEIDHLRRAAVVLATQRYVTSVLDVLLPAPLEVLGRWCDVELVGFAYDEVDLRSAGSLGAGYVEVRVVVPDPFDPEPALGALLDPLITDARATVEALPYE